MERRQGHQADPEAKNHPPGLINVALEMVIKASLELPELAEIREHQPR